MAWGMVELLQTVAKIHSLWPNVLARRVGLFLFASQAIILRRVRDRPFVRQVSLERRQPDSFSLGTESASALQAERLWLPLRRAERFGLHPSCLSGYA